MKKTAVLIIAILTIAGFQNCAKSGIGGAGDSSNEKAATGPVVAAVIVEGVKVAPKLDGDSSTRIAIQGEYPTGCTYELDTKVSSSGDIHDVQLLEANPGERQANEICTQALVPFEHVVSLGEVSPGEHMVRVQNRQGSKEFTIQVP